MAGLKWPLAAVAGAALIGLAGCDNGPSAVAKDGRSETAAAAASSEDAAPAREETRTASREDHRAEPALKVGGEPMWASTRRYSAEEGAQRSFERNGKAFGADTVEAYVTKAHDFVAHPPSGAETIHRPNGDTLFYDAKSNVFAVANKDGLPKTMFKPDEGPDYWTEQKSRQSRRETARRDRPAERDEG